ncbi:hypothetical protein [Legionella yabuuchiae]|uniref:hypothetical protein n=1 Tax=Legionella yabuuchiae TaxID=376727 RepID=UPI001056BEF0|nr:hypothetical protein [Legionella yabuuchiae]
MNHYIANEFTIFEYERLLQLALNNFTFKKYHEIYHNEYFIVWRHDVDMSLEQALKIAKIENNHKVSSTYFIHLHNDFYNALDFSSYSLIKQIIAYGHTIGLHFDLSYYNINTLPKLNYWLQFEKNLLESLFEQEVSVFSFHNPNEIAMNFNEEIYAGMINTYSDYFKNKIHYCSDSNGFWRYKKLIDILNDQNIKQLQVLTHPEWWTEKALNPREKVIKYADQRKKIIISNYDKTLEIAGRVNIG